MGFNADSVLRKLFWGGKGFRKTSADFSPARRRGLGRNAGGPFVSDFLGFQKLKKHDKITIIMELVQDFKKISKKDVSLAGGKGASLGEMTGAGISVPPGFVILSSVFEKFLEGRSRTRDGRVRFVARNCCWAGCRVQESNQRQN